MKNKINLLKNIGCAALLALSLPLSAENHPTIDRIKANYKQLMMPHDAQSNDSLWNGLVSMERETEISDQMVEEIIRLFPFDDKEMNGYLDRLDAEGKWTDINYHDTKRSGWDGKKHAKRILELSKLLYSSDAPKYGEKRIEDAIHAALKFWYGANLRCPNWWYNEIGIPKTMGEALMLIEERLTPEEIQGGIEVMKNSKFKMTGQNKVWLAGNVLMRGLLENNLPLVKAARDTIASEIVLGRKEGIKNDWSFHQHGPQQQFGNYGMAFITGMCFYNRLFQGTELEFSAEQKQILASLIDEGFQWVIWKRYMDVNALGRQLFKNVQLHKGYYLAMNAQGLAESVYPKSVNVLTGHKHFYESDCTIHRTKNWMASVKMASNRVIGTEVINEDNLQGHYMGDGATYFYVRGDEYTNVFPLWDWIKIPGVTAHEDTRKVPRIAVARSRNKTNKVGGVTYQNQGYTAMELNRMGLKAYKSWLFTDNFVLCLGTGIQSDSVLNVTTSVEQRLKHGNFTVKEGNKWVPVTGKKIFSNNENRFFHDNMGYVVLNNATCVAESATRSGQWHNVMGMYRPETVNGEMVSLYLNHGSSPENGNYMYVVLPNSTMKETARFNVKDIDVIRNDSKAQIVRYKKNKDIYWLAVYQPGNFKLGKQNLHIDDAGIYCVKYNRHSLDLLSKDIFRK